MSTEAEWTAANWSRPVVVLVGPEGSFSPSEWEILKGNGAMGVRLSPYRLRAETAAIALLAGLAGLGEGRLPWQS